MPRPTGFGVQEGRETLNQLVLEIEPSTLKTEIETLNSEP